MKYTNPPNCITYKDAIKKGYCFAPSKYAIFCSRSSSKNVFFEKLENIILTSEIRKKIDSKNHYYYIQIGDIDINNGGIDYKHILGLRVPKNPLEVKFGDILISKVRTYRKGISFVNKNSNELVCSPAFLVIRSINNDYNITKEYLYSILRHDFFIEQILSLQNRGMYPRLDKNTKKEVLIPIPKNEKIIEYITKLIISLIDKEQMIREKFQKMNDIIKEELNKQQNKNKFVFNYPTYNEMKTNKRLDTGIYDFEYKKLIHLIKNYSNGFFYIPENKLKSGSTPKKRMMGNGTKKWVTPSIVNKFGYFDIYERIMCNKTNIKKDCILIINRTSKGGYGEYVGISVFYDFSKNGEAQHNQGFYRIDEYSEDELKIITIILNSQYYREMFGHISLGSKMKEVKINNFSNIPFPKFPDSIKRKLIDLYSQERKYTNNITIDNFDKIDEEITKSSGILELSEQINRIKYKLDLTIASIINNNEIKMNFDFLNF
jgi:hypothetical protein